MIRAFRGGLGFLTRLPVGHDRHAWEAFCRQPVAFVLVGYVLGALLVLPFVLPLPAPTAALVFVVWLYLLTGITHLDGVADLGDALAVHGDTDDRREALKDTTTGVGALLVVAIVVGGLLFAGVTLAGAPIEALGIVVAAEVGAKLGMVLIACLGTAIHDGLGSSLTAESEPRDLVVPAFVALPAVALTGVHPAAGATVAGTLAASLATLVLARRVLGGVNGDVFGASNELARLVGLHVGVVVWTGW